MHVHIRGHLPLDYYLKPYAYAKRLKADLHAMHELNEKNHMEAERLRSENARLKAEMLASEYQTKVLAELGNILAKPARKEDDNHA
jgi:hypothetical protein